MRTLQKSKAVMLKVARCFVDGAILLAQDRVYITQLNFQYNIASKFLCP